MKLKSILEGIDNFQLFGKDEIVVKEITDDSRKAAKGSLFVAIKGLTIDAQRFIPDVIDKEASVIVGEDDPDKKWLKKITYVKVPNSRNALGVMAANWYGNPSRKLTVIGITGSDGKTTTTNFIYNILKTAGKRVGMVSTINARIGKKDYDTGFHVTNPEPLALQSFLKKMVEEKCEYAVLEITSHGLDQGRVAGVKFDIAVLTNITHEHLDYHKTFENYRAAKTKLFQTAKISVLNKDDDSFGYIVSQLTREQTVATYGLAYPADYKAYGIVADAEKTTFKIQFEGGEEVLTMPFFGNYNVANASAAITAARKLDINWPAIKKGVANTPIPEGRLNRIDNKMGIDLFVDFAHTPNSLKQVLSLLKQTSKGRLITVFGCAGERDIEKRAMMGEISGNLSDISVFTAEDPRSEDVFAILKSISEGALKTGAVEIGSESDSKLDPTKHLYITIPERREAIFAVIRKIARPQDTVVICGKGHEKSMCYGKIEYPWSDKEAVEDALLSDVKKTAIILAGGLGSRLNSGKPKVIENLAGRPMISFTLENLRKAHFGKIIIVVGYKHELVEAIVKGSVDFALQNKALGTGHAVSVGLKYLKDKDVKDVVVLNGDDSAFYTPQTFEKILKHHREKKAVLTFVSLIKEDKAGLGRILRDTEGKLLGIIEEKDATDSEKEIKEVDDGLYVLNVKWAEYNLKKIKKHPSGEYRIVDLVRLALDQRKPVEAYQLNSNEEWHGVNTRAELLQADKIKTQLINE